MKFRIYQKTMRVLDSCETKEQLAMAYKFYALAIRELLRLSTPFCLVAIDELKIKLSERRDDLDPQPQQNLIAQHQYQQYAAMMQGMGTVFGIKP